jgi:hypothetical protein
MLVSECRTHAYLNVSLIVHMFNCIRVTLIQTCIFIQRIVDIFRSMHFYAILLYRIIFTILHFLHYLRIGLIT